jgi:hypothetical protein
MTCTRWFTVLSTAGLIALTSAVAAAQTAPENGRLDLSRLDRYVGLSSRSLEPRPPWVDSNAVKLPSYPFMADPRRWPRLFANTTECTLSLNPVTRRHWWQG